MRSGLRRAALLWLLVVAAVIGGLVCVKRVALGDARRITATALKDSGESPDPESVSYSILGRGTRVLSAVRTIGQGGEGATVFEVDLDLSSPHNLRMWLQAMRALTPFLEREAKWRREGLEAAVANVRGDVGQVDGYLFWRVRFPPGELAAGSVKLTVAACRSTSRLAWVTYELSDGYWFVTYRAYSQNAREGVRMGGVEHGADSAVRVKSCQEANSYVRRWIHANPDLLLAADFLSVLTE